MCALREDQKSTLQLRDVNDNKPVFLAKYNALTVTEDSPVGTSIAVVSARDDDRSKQVNREIQCI